VSKLANVIVAYRHLHIKTAHLHGCGGITVLGDSGVKHD
jgi:hypothetical protein